jgi:phenol 2-monooxygenase (NADPH)
MQYHLNGFKSGDPTVAVTKNTVDSPDGIIDVLIVGCGPAGLTLAAQLAAFSSIRTKIIDQKSGPLEVGQADGIACRSMEMFEAFGFADRVLKESYWVNETSFWRPGTKGTNGIERASRIQDVEDGLSEFPHTILNQARVHDFYLQSMRGGPARLRPDYNCRLTQLQLHPVKQAVEITLERTQADGKALAEQLLARYVVGCDGARSAVRRLLGHALNGESANKVWGVMDILCVTDFPDIRLKCAIQSESEGSLLIIPREGGYLVRMYIELDTLGVTERAVDRHITSEQLVAAAQRILHPYMLEVKEIAWWSAYEIGQRVSDSFDDVPDVERHARTPRIFIAGDACHTHSPKAGQGMNVSMADAFNLGWKLASVLLGHAEPKLLNTYSEERLAKAKELIEFDRDMAELFSARAKPDGIDPSKFQQYFAKHGRYTAGVQTRYDASLITGSGSHQQLAAGLLVGKRFHSAQVVRLADAKRMHLGHVVKADGRWRLFIFEAGSAESTLAEICEFLATSRRSPVVRYTPVGEDIDSVFDVRAVLQGHHRDRELCTLPPLLSPRKGCYGLIDYEKVFCSDIGDGQDIYTLRGIDRERGCVVIVRPDQFVADVLPLQSFELITAYFEAFMRDG